MKQFFKFFGAALLANFIFWIVLSFLFMISVVGFIALAVSEEKEVKVSEENSIVTISLDAPFLESRKPDVESEIARLFPEAEPLTISETVRAIVEAKNDENVKAILLLSNGISLYSFSAAERLREALIDFKKSGKKIYAYGDNMSEKNYLVSSVSDLIAMHPGGFFEWNGLSVRINFYHQLLEQSGIKMQVFYAGKYKSATEQFRLDKISPENREQLQTLIDQMANAMMRDVSSSRHIPFQELKNMADRLDVSAASSARAKSMIDDLLVYEAFKEKINHELFPDGKVKEDDIQYISIEEYKEGFKERDLINQDYDKSSSNEIALLYIDGKISPDDDDISDDYIDYIKEIEENDDIKAVVVRINSPGGSSAISESIWWQLSRLRKKKPLIMSLASVAASGGYYIASAGDSIFASPLCITGSIGVFAMFPSAEKLMKNKLRITFDEVRTSPHASMKDILTRDLDELESSKIQEIVDSTYSLFLDRVAKGRGMSKLSVQKIAQGRVWTAEDALKIGLIDGIGNEDRAIRSAAAKAKLSSFKVDTYPKEDESWIEKKFRKILRISEKEMSASALWDLKKTPIIKQTADEILRIKEDCGAPLTKLPYTMDGDISIR